MMKRSKHTLILEQAEYLAPAVRCLHFRTSKGEPFPFVAGQFVNLFLDLSGERVKRAYSIASAPNMDQPDRLEIAVTKVEGGPMSTALHAMKLGDEIEMEGPWGVFTRPPAHRDRPALFVGTGTGLAPLRSMLVDELRESASGPSMTVLFGCRHEEDILWREELEELSNRHQHVTFTTTLSRGNEPWDGRRGYVQTHLAELVPPLMPVHVYICGLSEMVQGVRKVLKEDLGLDRKSIHAERYD